jgi:hypothetical protein
LLDKRKFEFIILVWLMCGILRLGEMCYWMR